MAKGGGRPRPSHTLGFGFAEDPDLDPKEIGRKEVKAVYRMNLQMHVIDLILVARGRRRLVLLLHLVLHTTRRKGTLGIVKS